MRGWETDFNFVGLVNYFSIFTNDFFLKSFRNTCIVWILNFVPQLGLALLLAVWFTDLKLKLKGVGFFKVVFYLPNIITAGSVAVLFFSLFGYPNGPVNLILMQSGILEEPYNFFRSPMATRSIVAFIQFWMWYGNTLIMIIAGIMGISPSLYEAAMVDGANSRQMFTRITLPLLKPIMLYILVTSLIGGMQMFDIPFLLTNGNPDYSVETMSMFIYKQAFTGSRNFYMASTASVVLLLIVMVISIFAFRFLRSGEKEEV